MERDRDKLTRLMDVQSYTEAGLVCIPEDAPWVADFVTECEAFTADDGSPAGAAAVDLLAHMLGRVSVRAEELASIADRARIAGLMCERAYDGVRGAP